MTKPIRKNLAIFPGSESSETSSRCKICQLPIDVRQDFDRLRLEKGFSYYDVVDYFNSGLQDRLGAHTLPPGTEEISVSSLARHYQKHVSLDPDALYPSSRERQVEMLLKALHDRAALFLEMQKHLHTMLDLSTRKATEWGQLLESEHELRSVYHATASLRLAQWHRLNAEYAQEVADYETNLEAWSTTHVGEKPKPPSKDKVTAMADLLRVPRIPGMGEEEDRILKLVRELREQMTEMSKVLSYEDGYSTYINIELETLLQQFAEDSYQIVETFGTKVRNMVLPDKTGAFFEQVKTLLQEQNAKYRERYRAFFISTRKFASEMRGKT